MNESKFILDRHSKIFSVARHRSPYNYTHLVMKFGNYGESTSYLAKAKCRVIHQARRGIRARIRNIRESRAYRGVWLGNPSLYEIKLFKFFRDNVQ